MDNKNPRDQAIFKLSDFRKVKADHAVAEETPSSVSSNNPSKEEMHAKIMTAKLHANKEIDTFKKAVSDLKSTVRELVLFDGVENLVEDLLDNFADEVVGPMVKGINTSGIPDEEFKKLRLEKFKALISKYVDHK